MAAHFPFLLAYCRQCMTITSISYYCVPCAGPRPPSPETRSCLFLAIQHFLFKPSDRVSLWEFSHLSLFFDNFIRFLYSQPVRPIILPPLDVVSTPPPTFPMKLPPPRLAQRLGSFPCPFPCGVFSVLSAPQRSFFTAEGFQKHRTPVPPLSPLLFSLNFFPAFAESFLFALSLP